MKRFLPQLLLTVWIAVFAKNLLAGSQAGAERTKRVVSAAISQAKDGGSDGYEPIGNVEVTYKDGSKDLWTLKANCGQPHVAADGTVGWTVYEPERPAATASYNIRPNHTLVLCRRGKVISRLESALGFIEEWNFLNGGRGVALRTRALHGVAYIERHQSSTGKLEESVKAYLSDLPPWALPLADR